MNIYKLVFIHSFCGNIFNIVEKRQTLKYKHNVDKRIHIGINIVHKVINNLWTILS